MTVSDQEIEKAADLLSEGNLVSFPTETVYGLGANALDDKAVARIFEAKQRPQFNPLIVHVSDIVQVKSFTHMNELADQLAEVFWPGPLTLVLKRKPKCSLSKLVSAGLETVAVRIPNHEIAHKLLKASELPIAAPSANRSGQLSPTHASHVQKSLGDRVAHILDGGPCRVGLESTVIDATTDHPIVLRAGGMDTREIEKITGPLEIAKSDETAPKSPGMLLSHYAPSLPVRLNAHTKNDGEAFLGFGPDFPFADQNLSPTSNLVEAAANLFAMMHELDRGEFNGLAIAPIPQDGLGLAINDRIKKAAQPKNF